MDRPRKPLHSSGDYVYPEDTSRQYKKLTGFILFLLILSVVLTYGRGWEAKYLFQDFLAALLISSSAYKMFRLEIFTKIFQSYDAVAQKYPIWAYAYPFVELAIGADFLLSNGSKALYFITLIFFGLNIYSWVTHSRHRTHIAYACLDEIIQLPVATLNYIVSIICFSITLFIVIFA